mmetsp:Transcript_29141/g.66812  ORF Transcript_29141/g.66812 Transcript_29141/m.66812 type:complete len:129 (+) Transcript_29141:426-812(+)
MMARKLNRSNSARCKKMLIHKALAGRIKNFPSDPTTTGDGVTLHAGPITVTKGPKREVNSMSLKSTDALSPKPKKTSRTSKKRKRHPKEPIPPKKPMAPFFFFCDSMRQNRKEALAGKSITEQTKLIR